MTTDTESTPPPLPNVSTTKEYDGIGRIPFLLGLLGISFASTGLELYSSGSLLPSLLALVLSFVLVIARLRNIGANSWLSLLILAPLLNLYLVFRCLVEPEGYQDTKQLDKAGNIASLIIGYTLFVTVIAVLVIVVKSIMK